MAGQNRKPRWTRLNVHGELGQRHRVRAMGDGDAVIVFSHGLGTDRNAWLPVANQLTTDFLTVLFDLPGIGPHRPDDFEPNDFVSLTAYARALVELLKELGVQRCIFVGHSVSGMIGALASIEAPQLFEHLILLNGSPRYLNDTGYVGGFDAADVEGVLAAMAGNYAGWVAEFAPLAIHAESGAAVRQFADGLLAMQPDIMLKIAGMIYRSDHRDILGKIDTPTTLIHSQSDIAVPEEVAYYLHDQIKDSRLIRIRAAGHLPHLSAPMELVSVLRPILDENT